MSTAGYSGRPLAQKLGVAPGARVLVVRPPDGLDALLSPLPEGARLLRRAAGDVDMALAFCTRRAELARDLPRLAALLPPRGAVWAAWPKRASGVPTDVTEDVVRDVALPLGLVDVKVCAIDATWSGLRLVRRRTGG
ncbi:MAG: DUF3052 domain-containing protein [Actinomycetota bacterium]